MKPPKQNQELQNKGKRRAAGSTGDDPIESFPDEGPKAAGHRQGNLRLGRVKEYLSLLLCYNCITSWITFEIRYVIVLMTCLILYKHIVKDHDGNWSSEQVKSN